MPRLRIILAMACGATTVAAALAIFAAGCNDQPLDRVDENLKIITPTIISEGVHEDADDPAIWLHPSDRAQSLILGTDKGAPGALYVFDLNGKIIADKTVQNLAGPNNVDVEYGFAWQGTAIDIAVTTLKKTSQLRIFRLPDMQPLDGGGVPVFTGEVRRKCRPMGIALYRRPVDGAVFAIVSRKGGPRQGYLWQYLLQEDSTGQVQAVKVREFGKWSGRGEIESIAVDDALGYVYYSDELYGIRQYHADPDAPGANTELAVFGREGFVRDREGISIYAVTDSTGYILVSDQKANSFQVYQREGAAGAPHRHQFVTEIKVSAKESDGSEATSMALNSQFPAGLFVAMSDDRTFHYYSWADLAGDKLRRAAP